MFPVGRRHPPRIQAIRALFKKHLRFTRRSHMHQVRRIGGGEACHIPPLSAGGPVGLRPRNLSVQLPHRLLQRRLPPCLKRPRAKDLAAQRKKTSLACMVCYRFKTCFAKFCSESTEIHSLSNAQNRGKISKDFGIASFFFSRRPSCGGPGDGLAPGESLMTASPSSCASCPTRYSHTMALRCN